MDLISGSYESSRWCEAGVRHGEGWGGFYRIGHPGALVLDGESTNGHSKGFGIDCYGKLRINSPSCDTACGCLLWAADLCEFLSFVCSLRDGLLCVHNFGARSGDLLVEPVGAPPAGPFYSASLKRKISIVEFRTSRPNITGGGGACCHLHAYTRSRSPVSWSNENRW